MSESHTLFHPARNDKAGALANPASIANAGTSKLFFSYLSSFEYPLKVTVPFFREVFFRDEPERCRIHAIAQVSRSRAIIKQVAQMRITHFAANFNALHA